MIFYEYVWGRRCVYWIDGLRGDFYVWEIVGWCGEFYVERVEVDL